MSLDSIEDILGDIRDGRMAVILDDEDRENEGDLIMAAAKVRPEDVNFMARHARGLICLPLTRERCLKLGLPLMVNDNRSRFATNFTVSIEAAEGVTTGISAQDRARTIRAAADPAARREDLTQPGHVFPLMAQPGGVLTRAGHTEAAVDLARLAGLEPCGVLVEILNEDGSMARRPQLEAFARGHGLRMATIADLIRYRFEHEKTVVRVDERDVDTEWGRFRLISFRDTLYDRLHWALQRGPVHPERASLVRVHVPNVLGDLLNIERPDFGLPLRVAFETIAREGGILVVLGQADDADTVMGRLQGGGAPRTAGGDSASAGELRTYGIGAQILADLGVGKMRVLSAPKVFHGLAGFGLEVVDYVAPGDEPRGAKGAA